MPTADASRADAQGKGVAAFKILFGCILPGSVRDELPWSDSRRDSPLDQQVRQRLDYRLVRCRVRQEDVVFAFRQELLFASNFPVGAVCLSFYLCRAGANGIAPSGRTGGVEADRALKRPAIQIFAPSGRALGRGPGRLATARARRPGGRHLELRGSSPRKRLSPKLFGIQSPWLEATSVGPSTTARPEGVMPFHNGHYNPGCLGFPLRPSGTSVGGVAPPGAEAPGSIPTALRA